MPWSGAKQHFCVQFLTPSLSVLLVTSPYLSCSPPHSPPGPLRQTSCPQAPWPDPNLQGQRILGPSSSSKTCMVSPPRAWESTQSAAHTKEEGGSDRGPPVLAGTRQTSCASKCLWWTGLEVPQTWLLRNPPQECSSEVRSDVLM